MWADGCQADPQTQLAVSPDDCLERGRCALDFTAFACAVCWTAWGTIAWPNLSARNTQNTITTTILISSGAGTKPTTQMHRCRISIQVGWEGARGGGGGVPHEAQGNREEGARRLRRAGFIIGDNSEPTPTGINRVHRQENKHATVGRLPLEVQLLTQQMRSKCLCHCLPAFGCTIPRLPPIQPHPMAAVWSTQYGSVDRPLLWHHPLPVCTQPLGRAVRSNGLLRVLTTVCRTQRTA